MSSCDWRYLSAPRAWWRQLKFLSSVRLLTGALGPSVLNQALKSRFMPYLNTTEQPVSLSLLPCMPEQVFHNSRLLAGSEAMMLGMFAGSTMTAPAPLRTAIASAITLA